MFYPALSGALVPSTRTEYGDGYMLTTRVMEWYARQYLTDPAQLHDPRFAPLVAERFESLAPAMIQTAEFDPMRGEGEMYRDRLRAAGVSTVYRMTHGAIHGFLNAYAFMRDGRRAIREGGAFLGICFSKQQVADKGRTAGMAQAQPPVEPGLPANPAPTLTEGEVFA